MVLGWTNSLFTFMFAWDAVLQWMLCIWAAKYSGLYMQVEMSQGQCVHGLFIIVPLHHAGVRFDSPLHHAAVRFDSPLQNAAARSDSPMQDAAGSSNAVGNVTPCCLMQNSAARFASLLHNAVEIFDSQLHHAAGSQTSILITPRI